MNSLSLYREYFSKNKKQNFNPYEKAVLINEVVKNIFEELNAPPFELANSPLIVETKKIIDDIKIFANKYYPMRWEGKKVAIIDAFAIVRGIRHLFADKNYSILADDNISFYREYFLKEVPIADEKEFIAGIEQDLNGVLKFLAELKAQNKDLLPVQPKKPAPQKNSQLDWEKYIAATESARAKQAKIRRNDNKQKILAWYGEQANLTQVVKELQMPAQKLLEDLRNFSQNLTENYIVQFAMTQIEIFNLVADNFGWHAPRAEASQNKNYYDAVENYKVYLEMIIDALADFGIEEISSDDGAKFDSKIHDVKNTKNFYPPTTTIKKSLRSGFRYGNLILQKEEVEV